MDKEPQLRKKQISNNKKKHKDNIYNNKSIRIKEEQMNKLKEKRCN